MLRLDDAYLAPANYLQADCVSPAIIRNRHSSRSVSSVLSCPCSKEIMVVDDTPFNIFALKHMLHDKYHIDIEEAHNGQICIDKYLRQYHKPCGCKNRTYRLIFMDIGMPVMDGKEAIRQLMNIIREGDQI